MKTPSRGCLWTLGVIVAFVGGIFLFDAIVPSKAVRDLPAGATEVREYYKDFGITGDFTRLLKARIPEDQVAEYARKVGADSKEEGGAGQKYVSWTGGASWFRPKNPPRYFHSEPGYRILVGWEDGFVYFDATAW